MTKNLISLGGSLPVDNVQALAGTELKDVPDRYVRSELEYDNDVVSTDNDVEIPVIDLSRLLNQKSASDELAKFHSACLDWGFFQLMNHGVSEEVIEKMKVDMEDFFRLPLEEKKVYGQLPDSIEGYGQAFVKSDEQKLEWADMHLLITIPFKERNMRFWPNNPTSFRESVNKFSKDVQEVAMCLIGLMARNLGLESQVLTKPFENCIQSVRMNYYPPCRYSDKVLGLTPHSDASSLTLVLQVNQVNGLQIKKNGKWFPVKPILGAFVVNIVQIRHFRVWESLKALLHGYFIFSVVSRVAVSNTPVSACPTRTHNPDTTPTLLQIFALYHIVDVQIMTNGVYKSIEHRVVINPDKERLSIAVFHDPEISAIIEPVQDLVKKHGARYKTVRHADFLNQSINNKLDSKTFLDQFKL
ncbi:hypothetical protein IFM89_032109 [Coptis chinensis]|uniref:Fe2OG dioxygenase domain-containing protein n=1 Tax=Coptis chinensis TaxID=261450 RepID=A0A835ISF1_9MAGN|nr:hypothetical protein IFM89_032109 [Coptis chinensis]